MIIKNPTTEDVHMVDKFATSVFMPNTPEESMAKRFPGLLGERNLKHINCVYKKDMPVAAVNWYSSNIKSENTVITVGSIGAVYCLENERKNGYADILVKKTFSQMESEGISLCLISGRRGLYLRNGAKITGKEYVFSFNEREKSGDVIGISAENIHEYADIVYRFHSRKENRFIRSFEHTVEMLKGCASSHHNLRCEMFYTENGYVIVDINKKDLSVKPRVTEYGGDDIIKIFKHICYVTGSEITGIIERNDTEILSCIEDKNETEICGSIKIINFNLLLEQIKYKFIAAGIEQIKAEMKDDGYEIICSNENYFITDDNLYTLIFKGPSKELFKDNKMPEGFEKVFPVYLPKIDGLDYI